MSLTSSRADQQKKRHTPCRRGRSTKFCPTSFRNITYPIRTPALDQARSYYIRSQRAGDERHDILFPLHHLPLPACRAPHRPLNTKSFPRSNSKFPFCLTLSLRGYTRYPFMPLVINPFKSLLMHCDTFSHSSLAYTRTPPSLFSWFDFFSFFFCYCRQSPGAPQTGPNAAKRGRW